MKISKTKKIVIGALSAVSIFSFAGTLTATMAWFAFSTRGTVSFMGTSVYSSQQLQVGLKISDTDDFSAFIGEENQGFTYETIEGQKYLWAPAGAGLKTDVIQTYSRAHGHATNTLHPVTSREYAFGDDISLFRAPYEGSTHIYEANPISYCKLPLVFRVIISTMSTSTYSKNQPIWITDAVAEAANASSGDIHEGLRVHINGENKFIFNPSATEEGSTKVAGLLDLNGDGYYDSTATYSSGEEIIYGDYEGEATTKVATSEDAANLADVNNTSKNEPSTFLAKHKEGNTIYPSLDALTIKEAQYKSLADVYPDVNDGYYTNGIPVCITSNDSKAIGEAELTIYLEGWDHVVIDNELSSMFNLGLQFEINKI